MVSYKNFLEETVNRLKDKVNGKIELRHNDYGDLMSRYDIAVKFNCNLYFCVSCDLGSTIHQLYCSCKYEDTPLNYGYEVGVKKVMQQIADMAMDYIFK